MLVFKVLVLLILLPCQSFSFHEEATSVLNRQTQLAKVFLPLRGFANYNALKHHIYDKYPERVKQFNNDLILVIFAPAKVRNDIFEHGFKNIFQIKAQRGENYLSTRFNTERSLLLLSAQQYEAIKTSMRPKYGVVTTMAELLTLSKKMAPFGDDIYILKGKNKQRVTIFPGDSYNRIHEKAENGLNTCYSWDEIFLPWRYRHLLIPYLKHGSPSAVAIANVKRLEPGGNFDPILGSAAIADYVEFEIWGQVSLMDVRAFLPTQQDIPKYLRTKLKKAHVKVMSVSDLTETAG